MLRQLNDNSQGFWLNNWQLILYLRGEFLYASQEEAFPVEAFLTVNRGQMGTGLLPVITASKKIDVIRARFARLFKEKGNEKAWFGQKLPGN